MGIILDAFISSYTNLNTFLFLLVLNQKNVYKIVFVGLLIDFVFFDTKGVITVVLLMLFLVNKKMHNYYLVNIFNYLIVLSLLNIDFSLSSFVLQLIFIVLVEKHML